MAIRMASGNEAVAYAALHAGAKVITGYPGTPSSEVIGSLLKMKDTAGTHIEWSVNEKVAVEIAATNAWAGKRSLCTMKMSGLNVAYDSMVGIAHSGVIGGMVVYVCDDPGVTTGMCEQDTRGYALMTDMVMLEPGSVQDSYDMIVYAFELSEKIQAPVFVRSVTNVAQSHAAVDIGPRVLPDETAPVVKKDIEKYAKAGAKMCMAQHRDCIRALAKAAELIHADGLHKLTLSGEPGGLGVVTAGVMKQYVDEALSLAERYGWKRRPVSVLRTACSVPYPREELDELLNHCGTVVAAEELEPYLERELCVRAHQFKKDVRVVGKLDGTLDKVGSLNALHVAKAILAADGVAFPEEAFAAGAAEAEQALPRPITCCAGCPHRGTYMAINSALRKAGYKKDEVIVTGDIGCTILGMNPPFDTIWMEISMGASIPCAQGFVYSGVDKPVIATIGDSTLFHNGLPGLVNAIQHNIDVTVIVMDNGWTAMTGMQVNPNTAQEFQNGEWQNVDLVELLRGTGVSQIYVTDPFDQIDMTRVLGACLAQKGVKIVVARRECAIQSNRRGVIYARMRVDPAKCIDCRACIRITGCPALSAAEGHVEIDQSVCNGCGLCSTVCPKGAIGKEA